MLRVELERVFVFLRALMFIYLLDLCIDIESCEIR